MSLDELQRQWAAQGERIDALVRINRQLLQQQSLQPVRASLRWSRAGDLSEAVLALLCLLATGTFIGAHIGDPRFLLPGAVMHLWFIATLVVAIRRFVGKGAIQYDAPVLTIQRQLEAIQAFTLRAVRVLVVSGLVVWGAPFWIIAARAWFGWDVYAWPGPQVLLYVLGTSVLLGVLTLATCGYLAQRLSRLPGLQRLARDLAGGYNLKVARERLAKLAQLGGES